MNLGSTKNPYVYRTVTVRFDPKVVPLNTGAGIFNAPIGFPGEHDLVLCKGILIHIPPDELDYVYSVIYHSAKKYILLCEYYNPTPVMVNYRGEDNKLWKRDFCSEMLDKYPDLSLIDYGFSYHRDEMGQDDLNWFLLEKTK